MGDEQMIKVRGVDLCVETFGDRADPALLLIAGATSSMDQWDDELCRRLAAGGRFVVRYDQRDTGRSVSYPAGSPGYTFDDLAADALGLLDVFGLARAHLVGISMGGAVAQTLALRHPDRVASLTLLSTSPVTRSPGSPALPPSSPELQARFADPPPEPDWSDRAAVIDYLVEGQRPFEARSRSFDEAAVRALAGRIVDRTTNLAAAMTNHWLLGGEPVTGQLGDVRAPTLVLHGAEDPLFAVAHAEALTREIPGARLILLERTGHEFPRRHIWDQVVPAVLAHTATG
jgi:pimeloyl-ACP methyl ester carboxylesterase